MAVDSVGRMVSSPEDGGAGANRPTLANLAEHVAKEMTGGPANPAAPPPAPAPAQPAPVVQPVVPKAGAGPTPAATPAPQAARPSTPATDVTPAVPVEDAATVTRLRQQNATLNKLVARLGIDPDSEDADLAAKGLIDVEQLLRRPAAAAPAPPASPDIPLNQRIINIQNRLKGDGDVSAVEYRQTVGDLLNVITDLTQDVNNTKEQERRRTIENVQRSFVEAAGGTVDQSEKIRKYVSDDGLRIALREMIVGAADVGITQLANHPQIGARAYTQERYREQGQAAVGRLETILDAVFAAGQRAAAEAIAQPHNAVVPAGPGGGQGPAAPPPRQMKLGDLTGNVKAYLQEQANARARPL